MKKIWYKKDHKITCTACEEVLETVHMGQTDQFVRVCLEYIDK